MQQTPTVVRGGVDVAEPTPVPTLVPRSWGWPVRQHNSSVLLETTSGFCGVEMRQRLGEAVLRLLCAAGVEGPVVRVMRPDPWLVFLAEADDVVGPGTLHHAASVVQGGRMIPLPPTDTGTGRTSWAVPPRPDHRWLPALSTIVWALTTVAPTR